MSKRIKIPDRVLDDYDRMIIGLTNGTRKPKNKEERRLLKQIKEIQAKGGIVDIPHEV